MQFIFKIIFMVCFKGSFNSVVVLFSFIFCTTVKSYQVEHLFAV